MLYPTLTGAAASLAALTALLLLNLLVLWAVLSHRRNLRSAPAAVMAAVMVWLCGCSAQSGGTAGAEDAAQSGKASTESTEADRTATESGTAGQTAGTPYLPDSTNLEVLCFSVGKADAFLLTTAHSAVLIDAGEKGFGKTILAALEERGISQLDYLIVTHFDQDHVGGAAKVLNNFPVSSVLESNHPKDSEEYEKYRKALNNAGLEAQTVRETMDFTLNGVSFSIDPPRKSNYQSDDSNNSSLIITVQSGDDRLLFMGDAQTERLEEFLTWNTDTCTVLKVPHHGKEEPLMEALVEAVQPQYAVITSSDEEPEAASTLAALDGAEVYLTRQGEVVIRCGDAGLEIGYA